MSTGYLNGRQPALPHSLALDDSNRLELQQWLRVLPNQRYVARAQWQGRSVLAKLFVGNKAQRHRARECVGVAALHTGGIASPQQLASGRNGELHWVLFEFLPNAVSLGQQWQAVEQQPLLSASQQSVLHQALDAIAGLHRQGLWQSDLHLDNFLLHQGRLYVIDGGGVEQQQPGQLLAPAQARQNLAVFFAQLPPALDDWLSALLQHYQQQGGQAGFDLAELRTAIAGIRRWRIRDYLKKTARDCSLFSVQKSLSSLRAVQRARLDEVAGLIDQPDAFIAGGHIYKTGGAATVARVEHQGQSWIIKRYNIKNFMHWLKRCWRPSRAWHSWQAGYLLQLQGIAVAQNIAVREQRRLGLRSVAWLVSDYHGDQDLIARFAPYVESGEVPQHDLQQLQQLLNGLIRAKISHGDLKGHNILWHNDRCLLIDLDAVRQHRSHARFVRAFARDRARLLRNWPKNSRLYQLLNEKLPQAQ